MAASTRMPVVLEIASSRRCLSCSAFPQLGELFVSAMQFGVIGVLAFGDEPRPLFHA